MKDTGWMLPLLRLHDIILDMYVYRLCFPSSLMSCLDEFGGCLSFSYISSSVPPIYIHFSCPFKKLVMSVISCLLIKHTFSLKCKWFTVLDETLLCSKVTQLYINAFFFLHSFPLWFIPGYFPVLYYMCCCLAIPYTIVCIC